MNLPHRSKLFLLLGIITLTIMFCAGIPRQSFGQTTAPQAEIPFTYRQVDDNAGDIKMLGDIDGDGLLDMVLGGSTGENLNWYRYPDFRKTVIAAPNTEFTTEGELGDVDGDGDLDIVVPDGPGNGNLVWFENPRPGGDPLVGSQWVRHTIGTIGSWGKDIELADFDGDGRLDVAARSDGNDTAMIFFQNAPDDWSKTPFNGLTTGLEGLGSGDIDGDNDTDLVVQGQWVRNPGGSAARTASNWTQFPIGTADSNFKAVVTDIDGNGVMDVLFSSSENTADIQWWTPATGDPTGTWTATTIAASVNRAHSLQAADMDLDGDIDVIVGQMHTSGDKELSIFYNLGGQGTSWQQQVIDSTRGIHNAVIGDIDGDGDIDIYGANFTGNPPLGFYENQLAQSDPLDLWTYKQITGSHALTFGLAFGDVDGDGNLDILSGRYWYRNPGGDLMGDWAQTAFPAGMHAILSLDVDGDAFADVIAQKDDGDIGLYWLEAADAGGSTWTSVAIGTLPRASHALGAQGYRSAQIETGGSPEIAVSSGNGIYYFRIPANPTAGNWPRVQISPNPSDEGFAFGDIDNDGDLDLAATTGDSLRVEWYRNPGDGSANWTAFLVGTLANVDFPDRTELADMDGDGDLDVIVTEENGTASNAETYWWAQPADPTTPNWPAIQITSQGTTNSLDVADMDGDGDPDVVLAEHRGSLKLAIWENDGSGSLTEHVVDTGKESHLGAQTVDLDGDGDLDIVSIAFDAPQNIHLWRNDAFPGSTNPTPTPTLPPGVTPTPTPTPTPTLPPGVTPTPTPTPNLQSLYLPLIFNFNSAAAALPQQPAASNPPANTLPGQTLLQHPLLPVFVLLGMGALVIIWLGVSALRGDRLHISTGEKA